MEREREMQSLLEFGHDAVRLWVRTIHHHHARTVGHPRVLDDGDEQNIQQSGHEGKQEKEFGLHDDDDDCIKNR